MFGINKALQYLAITPAAVQLVFALVKLFETEGNGEIKKQTVLDTVSMVYDEINLVIPLKVSKEFILKVSESTIGIAVNFFNIVGVFKKGDADKA